MRGHAAIDDFHAPATTDDRPTIVRERGGGGGRRRALNPAMVRRKIPMAALGGTPDQIEARLYEALQQGDLETLMSLWSDDEDIVCVHPGGTRVIGMAAIRASFEAIFANGPIPVRPEHVHRIDGLSSAVHHLSECVEVKTQDGPRLAWVTATNVYVKTSFGWRLVAHHASPGGMEEPDDGEAPSTLH